jgi:hypothetical protein
LLSIIVAGVVAQAFVADFATPVLGGRSGGIAGDDVFRGEFASAVIA